MKPGRPRREGNPLPPPWAIRLKAAREAANFSQVQIAGRVGRSQTTIADYEGGRSEPDLETFGRLAKVLMVNKAWLIFGDDTGNVSSCPNDDADRLFISFSSKNVDPLFIWTLARTADLISNEGLSVDLAYILAFARKMFSAAKPEEVSIAKDRIEQAIETERIEIRKGIADVAKQRLLGKNFSNG